MFGNCYNRAREKKDFDHKIDEWTRQQSPFNKGMHVVRRNCGKRDMVFCLSGDTRMSIVYCVDHKRKIVNDAHIKMRVKSDKYGLWMGRITLKMQK